MDHTTGREEGEGDGLERERRSCRFVTRVIERKINENEVEGTVAGFENPRHECYFRPNLKDRHTFWSSAKKNIFSRTCIISGIFRQISLLTSNNYD